MVRILREDLVVIFGFPSLLTTFAFALSLSVEVKQESKEQQQLWLIYSVIKMTSSSSSSSSNFLFGWAFVGAAVYAISMLAYWAWRIRMGAIEEYGPVIHEFDPWFNYRATEVSVGIMGNVCF